MTAGGVRGRLAHTDPRHPDQFSVLEKFRGKAVAADLHPRVHGIELAEHTAAHPARLVCRSHRQPHLIPHAAVGKGALFQNQDKFVRAIGGARGQPAHGMTRFRLAERGDLARHKCPMRNQLLI